MKSDYYTTVCWKVRWLHWKGLFKALFYIHTVYINIYIYLKYALSLILLQTIRTFSLKGMTSKLFGQETPEQREAKLKTLETQIEEGEEMVKERNAECE